MTQVNPRDALEAQIRECLGRAIYTHKTHSRMADRCGNVLRRVKYGQIVLSALTASGLVAILLTDTQWIKIATTVIAFLTVALSSYTKGFDPGAAAQKHRETAAAIWPIRESYLSLLTDIVGGQAELTALGERRDQLQAQLAAIYRNAPHTDSAAYQDAQDALKMREDYTFTTEEIDRFLPPALKLAPRS